MNVAINGHNVSEQNTLSQAKRTVPKLSPTNQPTRSNCIFQPRALSILGRKSCIMTELQTMWLPAFMCVTRNRNTIAEREAVLNYIMNILQTVLSVTMQQALAAWHPRGPARES